MAKRGENIYKRKDGRYEGRYIKGRRVDGNPIFGYVYGYTYAEVKTLLTFNKASVMKDGGQALRIIGDGSFGEFLCCWLESTRETVKQSTYAQYAERVNTHILPALGWVSIRSLTTERVQEFIDNLCKNGLSPSTVAGIARLLHSALKKARELQLITGNSCDGVDLPAIIKNESPVLDRAEQISLEKLAGTAGKDVELAVFIALYSGLRIGEICALRWRDIDLFSGTVTVRRTLQRIENFEGGETKTVLLEGTPKSRQSMRRIPFPAGITDKLRRYGLGVSVDSYVLTCCEKPIEPRRLRARFKKIAEKAGLSIPFHTLRHTYATRCLEYNFDVQTLSELLGHSSADITMKVYAHSVFGHKKLLTDRIFILSENNKPSNEPSVVNLHIAQTL